MFFATRSMEETTLTMVAGRSNSAAEKRLQYEQGQTVALGEEVLRQLLPLEDETRRHPKPEMGVVAVTLPVE